MDVIDILTDSDNPNNYWKVLKHRLTKEGSELVTNCNQLKMQFFFILFDVIQKIQKNEPVTNCNRLKSEVEDSKMQLTDVTDSEQFS